MAIDFLLYAVVGYQDPTIATKNENMATSRNRLTGKLNWNGISVKRLNCSVSVAAVNTPARGI